MSANSSSQNPSDKPSLLGRSLRSIGVSAWVFFGFILAQVVVIGVLLGLRALHVNLTLISPTILDTVIAALVYALSISIVIAVPWWVRKIKTDRRDLGLTRLPEWFDILLAPAGFVVYLVLSSLIGFIALKFVPGFDASQAQDVGYQNLTGHLQILLAFVTLVVVAPFAEEVLMRGYLYGKLRKIIPVWAAGLLTSIVFGVLHGQWNVGLDVFALSLVLCSLREVTGSIWAGVLLHMMKNGLAFYLLFINPMFLHTIGG